jgi:hypothetical protein
MSFFFKLDQRASLRRSPLVLRAAHKKSRPVSRVLSRAIIPLGSPSPWTSSSLPGSARGSALQPPCGRMRLPYLALLQVGFAVPSVLPPMRCALTAPFHPCRSPWGLRRSALCCTFRGLAPPRRYLAPDPQEPGLSSTEANFSSDRPADSPHTIRPQRWMSIVRCFGFIRNCSSGSAAGCAPHRERIRRGACGTGELRRNRGDSPRGQLLRQHLDGAT